MLTLRLSASLFCILLLAGGCASDEDSVEDSSVSNSAPVTAAELASASYTGLFAAPIRLSDGKFVGKTYAPGSTTRPVAELVTALQLHGDLNGDNLTEALVLLTTTSGGTGTYTHLALMGRRDGQLENLDTVLLGDRVQVRNLKSDGAMVLVELVEPGPEEAVCCPQSVVQQQFQLIDDRLLFQRKVEIDRLSLDMLEGATWDLVRLSVHETDLLPGTVTLEVRDQRFAGSSGCNRYQTSVTETDAGSLTLGPIAGTMMACGPPQDALETRYLAALQNVKQMGFVFGQLALTYDGENGTDQLIFSRQNSTE